MSITRAQQAKQLLAQGGRTGFQGGGADLGAGASGMGSGGRDRDKDRADTREQRSVASTMGTSPRSVSDLGIERDTGLERARQRNINLLDDFKSKRPKVNVPGLFGRLLKKPIQKFADFSARKNRPFFEEVIRAGKIPGLNFATVANMTPEELEQQYDNYMSARLSGEIDAFGNLLNQGDDSSPLLRTGIMAQAPKEDEEEDPFFPNFRLMADGGRVGLQEGGGIEQRLEKLGGDVSSAEQMLQGINQRLQTAESSLSSGGRGPGGLGTLATLAGSNQPFNPGNFQPALPDTGLANITVPPPPPGATFTPLPEDKNIFMGNMNPVGGPSDKLIPLEENPYFQNIPEQFRSGFANYLKENPNSFGFGGQMMSSVGLPGGGSVTFGDTGSAGAFRDYLESTGFTPPSPLGRPIQLPGIQPGAAIQDLATQVVQSPQQDPNIFGYDPSESASIQDRYSTAQQAAEKARKEGFAGRIKLPGEMSFEEFSDLYNRGGLTPLRAAGSDELGFANLESLGNFGKLNFIPMRGGAEMMEAAGIPMGRSSGIPAAGYADGGLANIARQELVFGGVADAIGKGLKKATRAIKKIAKSPIGKAALLYAGGSYLSGKGLFGNLKGAGFLKTAPATIKAQAAAAGLSPREFMMGMGGKTPQGPGGILGFIQKNPMLSIFGASAAAGLMTPKDEEIKTTDFGPDIDDPELIMRYPELYRNFRQFAEGGSTDKEPVAKKTMPLLDMGGKEMDLRAEGGFVPIGRMEKADDVPARLSKNEFVFTADAVRNAGDGDVDKGAEVMYNMMKNLEAGGEVSEESQGMDGARKMFQTSQRLGEVL